MNDRRKNCNWTPQENRDQSETLGTTQSKLNTNRLRKSPKSNQTQKPAINHPTEEADFKTPTRLSRLGFRNCNADESPNNDSELQHEIIWDATSPVTPVRNGRSRRRTAAYRSVDISEIVNRIAPKNMRSEEADSTLLQWIGDTAVPCTPEIRVPRTKTKPARQNPVDDLLKLAKQFDFNMFQQEEAHLRSIPQSSAKAMQDQEQDLFVNKNDTLQFSSNSERPPLGIKDTKKNNDDDSQSSDSLGLVQETNDDLDFLFDGSTQQLSGDLSQRSSTRSQDVVITPQSGTITGMVKNICGVTRVGGTFESSTTSVHGIAPILAMKQVADADNFDDDWNDDNLLNDSLVIEMTQNPELFAAPQHSSTQIQTDTNTTYHQSGINKASCGRTQQFNQKPKNVQPSQYCNKAIGLNSVNNKETLAIASGFHCVSKSNTQPKKITENRQHLATTSVNIMWRSSLAARLDTSRIVPMDTPESTPVNRINSVTKEVENDLVSEDLDSIFASDDIWDDGADDDDLFCEACEKVEESMAEPETLSKASLSTPQHSPQNCKSGFLQSSAPKALGNNILALHNSKMSSRRMYGFSHGESTTGTGSTPHNTARQVSESPTASTNKNDYRFKKPPPVTFIDTPSVSKDVSKTVGTRCSDAEIEKKKQQAMERRRLRMLANQNLRAPV